MVTRADIVAKVRSYKDTPWHHMGRKPGVGMDCAGVLICAGRDLNLVSNDFDVSNYLSAPDGHSLLEWCEKYMGGRVFRNAMKPGDAIVLKSGDRPQHLAVLGDYVHGGLSIIHSSSDSFPKRVVETRLMFTSKLKFVAAYKFPGIEE